MLSSFILLSLGATCWYTNLKLLENYFTVERVLDSTIHYQELALLATFPIALMLINLEPFYALLIIVYIIFCRRALMQLFNLIYRAVCLPVHFVDVLFGDFMTSYAKVFADIATITPLKPWITWYLFINIAYLMQFAESSVCTNISTTKRKFSCLISLNICLLFQLFSQDI